MTLKLKTITLHAQEQLGTSASKSGKIGKCKLMYNLCPSTQESNNKPNGSALRQRQGNAKKGKRDRGTGQESEDFQIKSNKNLGHQTCK